MDNSLPLMLHSCSYAISNAAMVKVGYTPRAPWVIGMINHKAMYPSEYSQYLSFVKLCIPARLFAQTVGCYSMQHCGLTHENSEPTVIQSLRISHWWGKIYIRAGESLDHTHFCLIHAHLAWYFAARPGLETTVSQPEQTLYLLFLKFHMISHS